MFSWNQYSYVWNLRHSRGDGQRASTEEKSCETERKICVSAALCCGCACKTLRNASKKARTQITLLASFRFLHWGRLTATFPLSSWECNTIRKLLIWEELVGWFSNYSAPSSLARLRPPQKWKQPAHCAYMWEDLTTATECPSIKPDPFRVDYPAPEVRRINRMMWLLVHTRLTSLTYSVLTHDGAALSLIRQRHNRLVWANAHR